MIGLGACGALTRAAEAGLLGINPPAVTTDTNPNIFSQDLGIIYDGSTGKLTIDNPPIYTPPLNYPTSPFNFFTGGPSNQGLQIPPPDPSNAHSNSAFHIDMTFNTSTGVPTGGNFSLTGTYPSLGANSGTLLQGTFDAANYPSNFGYTSTGSEFQFIFNTTGGDFAANFSQIAVDVSQIQLVDSSNNPYTFTGFGSTSFTGYDVADPDAFLDSAPPSALADTYSWPPSISVPEPSSLPLFLFGTAIVIAVQFLRRGRTLLQGQPE